jgi:hypothetical protein
MPAALRGDIVMSKPHSKPCLLNLPLPGSIQGSALWNYVPRTSWFSHFITINKNSGDATVEEHVLNDVGSYGLQLGEILDALDVIAKLTLADRDRLSNEEIVKLEQVRGLHEKVKAITAQYP